MLKKSLLLFCLLALCSSFSFANKRSPFLIIDMIPHMTMQVKKNWDNKELALSSTQKIKLLKIRKETISSIVALKELLAPLEKEVAAKILTGSKPSELVSTVNKIVSFKAQATQTHLSCVYKTQKVLNKKQLEALKSL